MNVLKKNKKPINKAEIETMNNSRENKPLCGKGMAMVEYCRD